ncbi:MAG: SixA phosphatase family protein, partial [Arenimonas sp.]|uniref:SixA phosphatase family protein n=1 Tax=Arenimonas sp. TaxID=1872635 RepID=UPI003C0E9931
ASEPPADPPLSAAGEQRAMILAGRLANANPAAIYTSQYQRTQLTAKRLAQAIGIGITVVPIDKANAGEIPQQLRERICAQPANTSAVIIGHSNTIPAIAEAWTAESVRPIADDEYNRILIIKLKDCQAAGWLDIRY